MPSHASMLSVDAFSYWDHICGTSALATHQATLARKEAILEAAAKRDEAQLLIGREEAKLEPLAA